MVNDLKFFKLISMAELGHAVTHCSTSPKEHLRECVNSLLDKSVTVNLTNMVVKFDSGGSIHFIGPGKTIGHNPTSIFFDEA